MASFWTWLWRFRMLWWMERRAAAGLHTHEGRREAARQAVALTAQVRRLRVSKVQRSRAAPSSLADVLTYIGWQRAAAARNDAADVAEASRLRATDRRKLELTLEAAAEEGAMSALDDLADWIGSAMPAAAKPARKRVK